MRLHVGNLRWSATDDELRKFFAQAGEVASVEIICDPFSGKSRGFGFVEMPNAEESKRAIEQLNGAEFRGLAISVNEARPRSKMRFE
jgi:RNA recognition motif-containing protein